MNLLELLPFPPVKECKEKILIILLLNHIKLILILIIVKFEDMRVIEINDMLYKISDRDYTFIKDKVEKYLLREASKTEIKQVIDRILHYNKPAIADLSIKEIYEGEYGIKFNEQNYWNSYIIIIKVIDRTFYNNFLKFYNIILT